MKKIDESEVSKLREFAIAYSDINGKDFGNNVPWIENNYNSKKECMEWVVKLTSKGFQRITPFTYEQDEVLEEEINWDFVEKHRI